MFSSPKTVHMDGNPHYQPALDTTDPTRALVHATLALAFEQRTATLVELRQDTRFAVKHLDAIQQRIHGGLDLG